MAYVTAAITLQEDCKIVAALPYLKENCAEHRKWMRRKKVSVPPDTNPMDWHNDDSGAPP
jgi:hypothetical protein